MLFPPIRKTALLPAALPFSVNKRVLLPLFSAFTKNAEPDSKLLHTEFAAP